MIRSIVLKEHSYILESDRDSNEPTIFYIFPKTVRGTTESAANYSKAYKDKKRTGGREIDINAMNHADVKEWCTAVKKVENYGILPNSPGSEDGRSSYNYFLLKVDEAPDVYIKDDTGLIVIKETSDPDDLKNIYFSMSPKDVEEVMAAVVDYSSLTESEKNV